MDNRSLEQCVIAKMITDPSSLGFAALNKIQPNHFETREAEIIYGFLLNLSSQSNGPERLQQVGFTAVKILLIPTLATDQHKQYLDYIDECQGHVDTDSFEIAFEEWTRRMEIERTARGLRESMQVLRQSKDPIAAQAHFLSNFLGDRPNLEPEDLDEGLRARYDLRKARQVTGKDYCLSTGFPSLDEGMEGGLRPGEIMVIGGDSGVGKSALSTYFGVWFKQQDRPVLHISTENTMHQQMGRTEAMYYGINYRQWQNCDPSICIENIETIKYGKASHKTIRLFPGDYGVADTLLMIQWMKVRHNFDPDVVIIDSPDLLDASTNLPEYAKGKYNYILKHMYQQLSKFFQSKLKILITTSQMNRERIRHRQKEGMPGLADLSDSIDKERTADYIIMAFENEPMQKIQALGINVVKLRDSSKKTFPFMVRRRDMRFVEVQVDMAGELRELDFWPNKAI